MARRVDKPWGHEIVWAEGGSYVGKILVIEPGHRLSLQYHQVKDETILVQEGTLRLHLEDGSGVAHVEDVQAGESRHVAAGKKHRYEATADRVALIEVSTPELDDVVRLEDDFGREGTSEP
jgi:mannose-6-phosphate isomerase